MQYSEVPLATIVSVVIMVPLNTSHLALTEIS